MDIDNIAYKLHDYGFNIITWKLEGDRKEPYFPACELKNKWEGYKGNRLSKEKLKANIEGLKKEGLPVRIGFIPDKIQDGKYKGKYTWGIDFDNPDHDKTLGNSIEGCKKTGKYWEKSLKKGSHVIGITSSPLSESQFQLAQEHRNLDFQVFSVVENNEACKFLAIYGNFKHELHDLKPYDLGKGINDIIEKLSEGKEPTESQYNEPPDCIIAIKSGKDIKRGYRHNHRIALASFYKQEGLECDEIGFKIKEWNEKLSEPEPDNNVILNDVRDICSDKYTFGCNAIQNLDKCPYKDDITKCKWLDRRTRYKNPLFSYGALYKDGKKIRVNTCKLAQYILNHPDIHIKTVKDENTKLKEIYYYKVGYYHSDGEDFLEELLTKELIPDLATNNKRSEVIGYIKTQNREYIDELEPPKNLLNLKNGVLSIDTLELKPHNHEYGFINILPVEYNPKATSSKIEKFIKEVVMHDDVDLIYEMIGYALYRDYPIASGFILVGDGRNGKTVLINTICALLGRGNYSNQSFGDLLNKDTSTVMLYGKMANFDTELSKKEILDMSKFKALTGRDWISGRYLYHMSFSFMNYAKLFFNANGLPHIPEIDIALRERLITIPFPNTFLRGDKKTNPKLKEELTTPEELSGLLNVALKGLKRVLKKGDFSYKYNEDELTRYERIEKSEEEIMQYISVESGNWIVKEEIYRVYDEWAKLNKYPKKHIIEFSRLLKQYYPEINTQGTKQINGKRTPVYENISFDMKAFIEQYPELKNRIPEKFASITQGQNTLGVNQ